MKFRSLIHLAIGFLCTGMGILLVRSTVGESGIESHRAEAARVVECQKERGVKIRQFVTYKNAQVESLRVANLEHLTGEQIIRLSAWLGFYGETVLATGAEHPEALAGEHLREALNLAMIAGRR